VLRRSSHLLETEGLGSISIEQRIGLCLDHNLLSFIRRRIEDDDNPNTEVFDIDGSILILLEPRLPDLTLKRLGEKMRFAYHHTRDRWVLSCSRNALYNFFL
jgi:hypothetical protein